MSIVWPDAAGHSGSSCLLQASPTRHVPRRQLVEAGLVVWIPPTHSGQFGSLERASAAHRRAYPQSSGARTANAQPGSGFQPAFDPGLHSRAFGYVDHSLVAHEDFASKRPAVVLAGHAKTVSTNIPDHQD